MVSPLLPMHDVLVAHAEPILCVSSACVWQKCAFDANRKNGSKRYDLDKQAGAKAALDTKTPKTLRGTRKESSFGASPA